MEAIKKISAYSISLVILFTLGISIYLVREWLPALGYVFIISIIGIISCGFIFALLFGVIHLKQKYYNEDAIEVGQYGNYIYRHGKLIALKPLHSVTVREEKTEKQIANKAIIPTLKDILTNGFLLDCVRNGKMLLGYRVNGSDIVPRLGTFEDIRTCALGGKSRKGKSVTLFSILLQALLGRAKVLLCDTNHMKPSSITALMEPLWNFLIIGRNINEIRNVVEQFSNELEGRIGGTITRDKWNVWLLAIDEYTSLAIDRKFMKYLAMVLLRCANMGSGYNMYCIIGAQNWQASNIGGNALKSSLHAAIVHQLEINESRQLLAKPHDKEATSLKVGQMLLKDTTPETELLHTPLGTREDAYIVANILHEMNRRTFIKPDYTYQTEMTRYNPALLSPVKQSIQDERMPDLPQKNTSIQAITLQATQPVNNQQSNETDIATVNKVLTTALELKKLRITTVKDKEVQTVNSNGKIVRTVLRDVLGYDNRQYSSVIMPICDKYEL